MWHVLQVAFNAERQVGRVLALHGLEVYAPQFPPPPRTRPGSVRSRHARWVFPGYLFFRIGLGFSQWDVVRWTPGVRRILQQDGGPGVVADEIIDRIRVRLLERSVNPAPSRFSRGQAVVIEHGPLSMVDAIFQRELPASRRVEVLVQLLGRPLTVAIDPAILRPTG